MAFISISYVAQSPSATYIHTVSISNDYSTYSNAMLGISAKNCCVAGVDSFLDGFRMLLTVLLVISGTL